MRTGEDINGTESKRRNPEQITKNIKKRRFSGNNK
jgi:hypothetical protein